MVRRTGVCSRFWLLNPLQKKRVPDLYRLPEVFSFSETLLQPGATGNVPNSINVISEYGKRFCRKGPGKPAFFKKRIFRVIRKEFLHLL